MQRSIVGSFHNDIRCLRHTSPVRQGRIDRPQIQWFALAERDAEGGALPLATGNFNRGAVRPCNGFGKRQS